MRNDPRALAAVLRGIGTGAMAPLWERLPTLTMPATVLAGARDPLRARCRDGRRIDFFELREPVFADLAEQARRRLFFDCGWRFAIGDRGAARDRFLGVAELLANDVVELLADRTRRTLRRQHGRDRFGDVERRRHDARLVGQLDQLAQHRRGA